MPLSDQQVVSAWVDLTIHILKDTPANSPTFASRSLGYIGLTMHESVAQTSDSVISMGGQLYQLNQLPKPNQNVVAVLSLNVAQAQIIRSIYLQTSDKNKKRIDSLEQSIEKSLVESRKISREQINASKKYGFQIAQKIFEWSKTDGGHRAYLRNFDKKLKFVQKKGGWKPPLYAQSFSHHPLHPHWGKNRTFSTKNDSLKPPNFISYSDKKDSDYYNQFLEVYNQEKSLTQQQKEIAIYWGDDPDETPTPPGHSYYLANQVIKAKKPDIYTCAITFAQLGMSLSDAFRNCWKWKYEFFSERPNTYIVAHIDSTWNSFWPDPPFPAFPSGHAIQAAACATILAKQFGENIEIKDLLHVGRRRDEIRDVDFKPRSFTSVWDLAKEVANSRFYGGIHTQQDNKQGLLKGKETAENILKLKWKK